MTLPVVLFDYNCSVDCMGMGIAHMGIPWEWEKDKYLGMGMEGKANVESHSRTSLVCSLIDPCISCSVLVLLLLRVLWLMK